MRMMRERSFVNRGHRSPPRNEPGAPPKLQWVGRQAMSICSCACRSLATRQRQRRSSLREQEKDDSTEAAVGMKVVGIPCYGRSPCFPSSFTVLACDPFSPSCSVYSARLSPCQVNPLEVLRDLVVGLRSMTRRLLPRVRISGQNIQ